MQYERPNEFLCANNSPRYTTQQRRWKPKTNVDTSELPSMFAAAARLSSAPKNKNKENIQRRVHSDPHQEQTKEELIVTPKVPSMFQSSAEKNLGKPLTKSESPSTNASKPASNKASSVPQPRSKPAEKSPQLSKTLQSSVKTSKTASASAAPAESIISEKPSNAKKIPSKEEYREALKKTPELESEIEKQQRLLRDVQILQQAAKEAEEARRQVEEAARQKEENDRKKKEEEREKARRIQEIQRKREAVRREAERQARMKAEEESARLKEEAARRAEEARRRAKAEEAELRAREDQARRMSSIKQVETTSSNEERSRERSPLEIPDELPAIIDGNDVLRMLNMVNREAEDDLASISSVDTKSTSTSDLSGWDKMMQDKLNHFMGSNHDHALPDNYCSDSDNSDIDSDDEY